MTSGTGRADLAALRQQSHAAWLAFHTALEQYAVVRLQLAGALVREVAPDAHSLVVHDIRPLILRDGTGRVGWFDPEITGHPGLPATGALDLDPQALRQAACIAAEVAELNRYRSTIGDLAVDGWAESRGWDSPLNRNLVCLDVERAVRGVPPPPVFDVDEEYLRSWLDRFEFEDAGPGAYATWPSAQLSVCEQPLTAASIATLLRLADEDTYYETGLDTGFRVAGTWTALTAAGHLIAGVELQTGRRISIGPLTDRDVHELAGGRDGVDAAVVVVIVAIARMLNDAAGRDALVSMTGVVDAVLNVAQQAGWTAATRDPASGPPAEATPA
ncbi:hypothetical protein [Actinoplanes sp. L3-i22]|uniref:hypothetical protein n=1 Tax=Actinoplanes sp. L3-i22 TaxID=2836373 RepID=UPI001C75A9CE|nr:hypothetical protein [Actinoplanes sp. L3-i22]BCY09470.1 hypothetical protein L3i22_045580 [Actinoplanes sp. L3-i22]